MGNLEEPGGFVGRRLGRYEVLRRFASGGMADLYLARLSGEEGFERIMALKVIHSHLGDQPEFVKMFIDEARLASRISHPNVALTLDLGRIGNTHFIVMEYVDGESVSSLLRQTKPPIPYGVRIVSDAAAGLHAAHELHGTDGDLLNVVHRDVSLANILISYDGAVKVVDFGVARARGSLHTTSNSFKGKFGYMSPEQFSAPGTVDRRTDIFALGVVLYEMTTWTRLFKAATEGETVERVLRGEIMPPSFLVRNYPPALEKIVMRALSRSPAERQQTAQELHEDLEKLLAATGVPVHSSAIGKMMREVFAERIKEKRALLEKNLSTPSSPSSLLPLESLGSTSVSLHPSLVTFPGGRKRRTMIVVASVVLGSATTGVLVVRNRLAPMTNNTPPGLDRGADRKRADSVPQQVTISASAVPATATITLDGKPMSNPFELQRAPAPGFAELVISAPGHQTQRFPVPLSRGGTWTVALLADATQPGAARATKGNRKAVYKKKLDRKGQFLDNPYESGKGP